jgi:hypothetical protein
MVALWGKAMAMPTIPNLQVSRQDYPAGAAGPEKAIEKVISYIHEGRHNQLARQFAEGIIQQAGYAPNDRLTNAQAMQAFLGYVRDSVRYRPDAHMTETVQNPMITLCVPGAAACIPVGDCDDGTATLGWLGTGYGIPVRVLVQHFGNDTDHVLLEIQDDDGAWLACDFSNFNMDNNPVGWKPRAVSEYRIDPFSSQNLQVVGARDVEFVAVGRVRYLGALPKVAIGRLPPREVGVRRLGGIPDFQNAATDLANQVTAVIATGDTYAAASPVDPASALKAYKAAGQAGATIVGPEIDLAGASWVTQPLTHQAWVSNGDLQAITTTDAASLSRARTFVTNMQALWTQAISDGTEAVLTGRQPPRAAGTGKLLGFAAVAGILGGLAFAWSRR